MKSGVYDERATFVHPFTALVAGPTGCGKKIFVSNLLTGLDSLVHPKIKHTIYCYSIWQPQFEHLKQKLSSIEFFEGIYDTARLDTSQRTLLVIDDLMREASDNSTLLDLFTKGSHHKNTSVILITQNIFGRGRHTRTISLNSHYIILFKNPRDRTQISHLARQMYPHKVKFLEEAFQNATEDAHGYLLIDLKQDTLAELRIKTNIFEKIIYFVPK